LYENVCEYIKNNNIEHNEPLISVGKKRYGDKVSEAGETAAEATGINGYNHVTSHDLRRYFANTMLREHNVDREIIKYLGGWSSDKALEPYIIAPTYSEIQDELAWRGVLETDAPMPERMEGFENINDQLTELQRKFELHEISESVSGDLTKERLEEINEYLQHHQDPTQQTAQTTLGETDLQGVGEDTKKYIAGPLAAGTRAYDDMTGYITNILTNVWDRRVGVGPLQWAGDSLVRRGAIIGTLWLGVIGFLSIMFILDGVYINPVDRSVSGQKLLTGMLLMSALVANLLRPDQLSSQ
jgi:hypothetical protein